MGTSVAGTLDVTGFHETCALVIGSRDRKSQFAQLVADDRTRGDGGPTNWAGVHRQQATSAKRMSTRSQRRWCRPCVHTDDTCDKVE